MTPLTQLKVWQLKEFAKLTSPIEDKSVLPILSYLKISPDGTVTKNNLQIFCQMKIDIYPVNSIKDDLLIHEHTLFALVNNTNAELVSLEVKNDKNDEPNIYLSDGKTKVHHLFEDAGNYPEMPEFLEGETIELSQEVLRAIIVSKSFISTEESSLYRTVHVKDRFVIGLNYHITYIHEFETEFPNIILNAKQCDILAQFLAIKFYATEHHYFFKTDKCLFAFTQSDFTTPDFMPRVNMIKQLVAAEKDFKIFKKELIDFCELANQISTNKTSTCGLFTDDKGETLLMINDIEFKKGGTKEIYCEGIAKQFNFNARDTLASFKALPQEKFYCIVAANALIIKNGNAFACFAQSQIQKTD